MIKVLIVDDDKLVRKGISSSMPWSQFGMEVVGEASNGAKALEFLKSQQVDLMLTDLAMPVMSGIELMREVRQLYPEIYIVVLTLHQDFDYIQEALRLGAIDYIAKVQLEREQFEQVLGRIHNRIRELGGTRRKTPQLSEINTNCQKVYVLFSLKEEDIQDYWSELHLITEDIRLEIQSNCWMWASSAEDQYLLFEKLKEGVCKIPHGVLLILSDAQGKTWAQIQNWIIHFINNSLFYEYKPLGPILALTINEEKPSLTEPKDEDVDKIRRIWFMSPWTHNDSFCERLIEEIKILRLKKDQLIGLLYSLVMEWNHLFAQTQMGRISLIHSIRFWYEVEQWIKKTAEDIRKVNEQSSYSQEILDGVRKAVMVMQLNLEEAYTASELSQQLNISRSYFSQCFKELMGKTFNEYSRNIRIEKAKEYLANTNNTIFWIAERVGYSDEKYFSRIFRELTGMLPSEYRQLGIQDK